MVQVKAEQAMVGGQGQAVELVDQAEGDPLVAAATEGLSRGSWCSKAAWPM
jgi:hypothetical protein